MYTLAELRNLNPAELNKELTKAKQEVFRLGMAVRTGAEKNTSVVKKAKLYASRILTVINSLSNV